MRGFTLVETLVAATVMAVAIAALAHLAAIGVRQNASAVRALVALMAAQGKLEQLIAAVPVSGSGTETDDFRVAWTVAPLDPADPTIVRLQVCAFPPADGSPVAEACVATVRRSAP